MGKGAKLSKIGERKAIEEMTKIFMRRSPEKGAKCSLSVGIGDDCAAIDMGKEYLLVTTDVISRKTHVPRQATPWQIGWFLVAVNLSDVASKGGRPIGLVMALGLPRETEEKFLLDLARGMDDCARAYGTQIIGGDTKENSNLTIAGTALGLVKKERFMPRFGAKEGDLVAVTGRLGAAAAGYYSLGSNLGIKTAENAMLEPQPRIAEGIALAKSGAATSCMDISDGLATSLYQMTKLGCEIEVSKIPIAPETMEVERLTGKNALEQALYYGGDYELVCTLKQDMAKKAVRAVEKAGGRLAIIGKIGGKRKMLLDSNGKKMPLENRGYEHFL
ncbi:MAG: thiamine-phosphate kinase [Candidatus Thermoplasmatota archaeon]|nr:thiamine-phosphate kinase [Candidatus Thermoplasmatota archaeon]